MTSGPNWKKRSRDSIEFIFVRRISSEGLRPRGRRVESRVKRTSVGVCSREEVTVKIFSGAKMDNERRRNIKAVIVRSISTRSTFGGTGRIESPGALEDARKER